MRSRICIRQHPFLRNPIPIHQRHRTNLSDEEWLKLEYPTSCQTDRTRSEPTTSHSFLIDPAYIKRYRDPSRHDSYVLPDHHHPYEFRTRPTATQAHPSRPQEPADRARNVPSEARQARLTMEQSWLSSPAPVPQGAPDPIQLTVRTRMAVCFPGSSSHYIGMGSFLKTASGASASQFERTWEEAQAALNSFPSWIDSLNLPDHFLSLGYSPAHAALLGGPIRKSDHLSRSSDHSLFPSSSRFLKDIALNGPQSELSQASNAQPAILITSIACLRTLEEEMKIPIRSMRPVYAGHSSGEYTACVASGAVDFMSGVKLTRLYGLLSERAMEMHGLDPLTHGGREEGVSKPQEGHNETKAQMSALLVNPAYHDYHHRHPSHDPHSQLIQTINQFNAQNQAHPARQVHVASFNSSNQIVLSGSRAAVLAACLRLQELEIANRAADLPCSAPFHSRFMKPAAEGMRVGLEAVKFQEPHGPILIAPTRPDGAGAGLEYIRTGADVGVLKAHLAGSIAEPVWWAATVHELLHLHDPHPLHHLLFVGPGKALRNLALKQTVFDRLPPSHHRLLSLATLQDFHQFSFRHP